jgi:hypothetical protein
MSRHFQYWIADRYDDARFLKQYDSELYEGAMVMIDALGIDVSGWKNGYDENYNY